VELTALSWMPQSPGWHVDWPAICASCPWLVPLATTPQDPRHHAEGDVLTHTRMVVESLAANGGWRALDAQDRAELFLATLLHDVGKAETTVIAEDGAISAPNHARVGTSMTRRLLWTAEGVGFAVPIAQRERIAALVRLHGLPLWFFEKVDQQRRVISASLRARLDDVALLAEADVRGRMCQDADDLLLRVDLFRAYCDEQGCRQQPYPFPSDQARVRFCRSLQSDPYYAPYDDAWGEVILLSGLPGSGKDRWCLAHAQGLPVIALDAIRAELGVAPTDSQSPVIATAKERARALLRARRPFVWNATNVTRRMRDPLADLFIAYGARVRMVYVDAPLETILERNRSRPRPVPDAVIVRLAHRTEPPDLAEAHVVQWIDNAGRRPG